MSQHLARAGFSIPGAASELGIGEGTIRRAVDKGQIRIVEFGGLRRIPTLEVERIRVLLLGSVNKNTDGKIEVESYADYFPDQAADF